MTTRNGLGRQVVGAQVPLLGLALPLLASAILIETGSVAAIQQDQEVTILTLGDALERAALHNPQYRQVVNQLELAGPAEREAWGAFLPDLRFSYGTTQSFSRQETAVDFFGESIANPSVETRVSSYANQAVSASLDLFRGGSRFHALGEARAQARVNRRIGERELNRVSAEVLRQFLAVQRQKARLAVELELVAARERDVEVIQRRFELASVGRSDLLATELELDAQRMAVTRAQGDFAKGLLALKKVIGDPGLGPINVEEQEPEPFDPETLDVNALVLRAIRENPRVGEAEASLALRQAGLRAQQSRRWPSLSISTGVTRGSYGRDQKALFDLNPGDLSGSVSMSISIPVFTRFETTRAIGEARIQVRNAAEVIRQTELELREEIGARYVDLQTAWAGVRERSRRREFADERLRIVREEYRLATKSIEDLQAAIREQASALRDAEDQRYEFATALVGLYEAAGFVSIGGPTLGNISTDPERD